MLKNIHCCERMAMLLGDPKMPLEYFLIAREYGITLKHSPAIQGIGYCPWCEKRLPKSVREEFFNILEKEYGIEPAFDIQKDPNIPVEFKSDEWWKKRGL